MGSIVIPINRNADLNVKAKLEELRIPFVKGDAESHRFSIACKRGSEDADLSNAICFGVIVNAEEQTITVSGSIVGNVASITLDGACYAVEGNQRLQICVAIGTKVTTVYYGRMFVLPGPTDSVIDVGDIIPSLAEYQETINACRTATNEANNAATSANDASESASSAAETANESAATAEAAAAAAAEATAAALNIIPLTFADKTAAVGDWADTEDGSDYPYKASVACEGVSADMEADVYFAKADAESGNYSGYADCGAGVVNVYAAEIPGGTITISTIKAV